MQTCGALMTYVALMAAYLVGFSPIAFALFSAVLLCLGITLYSWSPVVPRAARTDSADIAMQSIVPTLSESMAELRSLQNEINALQSQFSAERTVQQSAPSDSANDRWNDHE